jgi:hypothetical protein
VQSAINNGRLTLGDGHKMKLDSGPFLVNVNMIDFEGKRVLVRIDQADTTWGKRVIVLDKPKMKMMMPRNPEPGKLKVNQRREQGVKVKVTSGMLLEKYARQQRVSVFRGLSGVKRERSPNLQLPHARLGQVETEERGIRHRLGAHGSQLACHRKSMTEREHGTTGMVAQYGRSTLRGQGS